MDTQLISWMIGFPFLGALILAFLPGRSQGSKTGASQWVALAFTLASAVVGIVLTLGIQPSAELQAVENFEWIPFYSIRYHLAVDGLNLLSILLVVLTFPLLIASYWNRNEEGSKGVHALLLLLEASLLGALCAQDLFLLTFFWGLSALPFYFLIGIWGGKDRESAAFRFIVASSIGTALLFAALILIYYSVEPHSFSIQELGQGRIEGKSLLFLGQSLDFSRVVFVCIVLAFALRAPVWPLHGWFVKVAEEAPPIVLVALGAVTVPVATTLFIRLTYSLFPGTIVLLSSMIVVVGGISLAIGAISMLAQRGLRLVFAYFSLIQVGLILLGMGSLTSAGLIGAIYQQLSIGFALAGFGLVLGILSQRFSSADFMDADRNAILGGLVTKAPWMATLMAVLVVGMIGFPGTAAFIGNALLFIGSYPDYPRITLLAGFTVVLIAYCLFTVYRLLFLGKENHQQEVQDFTAREKATLIPIVILILWFGIYPKPWIQLIRPTVQSLLDGAQ